MTHFHLGLRLVELFTLPKVAEGLFLLSRTSPSQDQVTKLLMMPRYLIDLEVTLTGHTVLTTVIQTSLTYRMATSSVQIVY